MKNNLLGNLISKSKEKKEVILNNTLKTGLIREDYKPIIDYKSLEIENSDKEILIECEKKLAHHIGEMRKNLFFISEGLYEAQKSLANYNGGTFCKWYEMLGLKKDFVYMCLKRYNLYLEYNSQKFFKISDRNIKDINKLKDEVNPEEIFKIINSEKINDEIKELKNTFSVRPKTTEKKKWINRKTQKEIEFLYEGIYLPKNNLSEIMVIYKENNQIYIKLKEEFNEEYKKD